MASLPGGMHRQDCSRDSQPAQGLASVHEDVLCRQRTFTGPLDGVAHHVHLWLRCQHVAEHIMLRGMLVTEPVHAQMHQVCTSEPAYRQMHASPDPASLRVPSCSQDGLRC